MEFLSLKDISKEFYGVRVLNKVNFDVRKGEIHGLIGENGAGKSTLMNIVSGMVPPTEGCMYIEGHAYQCKHPVEAEKKGIVHIHQELNILPELSVVENLFLGREIHTRGLLQEKEMNEQAQAIFDRLGQNLDVTMKAGELSIGHQQMIEIAKSLLHNEVKLIILDEPTASLTDHEVEKLFAIVLSLKKENNVSFVYVSHRMQELFHLCERLTVLRDGEYIATKKTNETNLDEIVTMMIGRNINDQYSTHSKTLTQDYDKPLLQVEQLGKSKVFSNISFNVYKGEILGFYGLVGAGRTDVMNAIYGSSTYDKGAVFIDGENYSSPSPSNSIKRGIGFLSEDRKAEGVLANFSVTYNISISNFARMSTWGIINDNKEAGIVSNLIERFSIRVNNAKHSILALSGGNQQKTLFSRCVNFPLKILLLDEPTRGIDVGSKHDVYELMREFANQGMGIIMVSSDLPEVLGVADRIAVMHEGRLIDIVDKEQASQEHIMYLSTNIGNKGMLDNET